MVLSARKPGRGQRDCRSCFEFFSREDLEKGLCVECAKKFFERACLRCEERFMSSGSHNRVCPECRLVNERGYIRRVYGMNGREVYMEVSRSK